MEAVIEQSYWYTAPSRLDPLARRLDLATSGSTGPDPGEGEAHDGVLFSGFVAQPERAAAALLAVAAVARTRFWSPPGMVAARVRAADPVVTAGAGILRFESFSPCYGVGARLDLLPGALDAPVLSAGTTNVDFNPDMRAALAGIAGLDPMHLTVGRDVTVRTLDATVTERKVPLPPRWVRGFGEAQNAAARMNAALTPTVAALRALLRALPAIPNTRATPTYVVQAGASLRVSSSGLVPLAGPQRLRVLEPLLRYCSGVTVDAAPEGQGGSVWRLDLTGARFTLALSADLGQGFSGEGGTLPELADASYEQAQAAATVEEVLQRIGTADNDTLAARTRLAPKALQGALTLLAASGRIGWDGAERTYFYRPLPFVGIDALDAPRLVAARTLAKSGAVTAARDDSARFTVTSAGTPYAVRFDTEGAGHCTCAWYGQHRGSRGPCKHVLAAQIHRGRALAADSPKSPPPAHAGVGVHLPADEND